DLRFAYGEPFGNDAGYDVPRIKTTNRAVIGDPRNDENVIISQLHTIFLRFHNGLIDLAHERHQNHFSALQQEDRWHYQWAILYDFLPTIVNEETYRTVWPYKYDHSSFATKLPDLRFYRCRQDAYLPVEFSAAAYRFGHATVRSTYRVNTGE